MLVLFESSVGYSLFRVLDAAKLKKMTTENIYQQISKFVQLHAFKFGTHWGTVLGLGSAERDLLSLCHSEGNVAAVRCRHTGAA